MNYQTNKFYKIGLVLFALVFIFLFDWVCPIERMFGIPCPGCNMTTAVYWLFIKHDLSIALYYHALLPLTILLLVMAFLHPSRIKTWLWIWALAMIIYWIYRMIFIFPNAPMTYQWNSVLGIVLKMFS